MAERGSNNGSSPDFEWLKGAAQDANPINRPTWSARPRVYSGMRLEGAVQRARNQRGVIPGGRYVQLAPEKNPKL